MQVCAHVHACEHMWVGGLELKRSGAGGCGGGQTIIEAVRALVAQAGVPGPAAMLGPTLAGAPADKYIGVRTKQTGFGAVIKVREFVCLRVCERESGTRREK